MRDLLAPDLRPVLTQLESLFGIDSCIVACLSHIVNLVQTVSQRS